MTERRVTNVLNNNYFLFGRKQRVNSIAEGSVHRDEIQTTIVRINRNELST